jgi:predicted O-linked N-acetylglucosamine transferase (SPINDLY family)
MPPLKFENNGHSPTVLLEHRDAAIARSLLREALGSASDEFVEGLICQLANAGSPHARDLNFALSIIKNVKPNDQLETMLAAQMAVTHVALMTFAHRLACVENIPQQDSAVNAFNRLARTYATQMEALKRYRTGGEQKVTVQHVSVNDGGQAIVGDVVQAPRPSNQQHPANAKEALTDARRPPMRLVEGIRGEAIPLKRAQTDDK